MTRAGAISPSSSTWPSPRPRSSRGMRRGERRTSAAPRSSPLAGGR
jgi:hypothetical protein